MLGFGLFFTLLLVLILVGAIAVGVVFIIRSISLKAALQNCQRSSKVAFQNINILGEIGNKLAGNLTEEIIIKTFCESINRLTDAPVFGIGIFNAALDRLEFIGTFDRGHTVKCYFDDLANENYLSVWCFNNQQPVMIRDYEQEYKNYIPYPVSDEERAGIVSVIYLPLISKDKVIGVLTIQSPKKNAYTEFDLDVLRNISNYAAFTLDKTKVYQLFENEVKRSNWLLDNILPKETAEEYKIRGSVAIRQYQQVTVAIIDFVGFIDLCETLTPLDVVNELDTYFAEFDVILKRHNLEKIKTVGGSYIYAGGIPIANRRHTFDIIVAAIEIQTFMNNMNRIKTKLKFPAWEIKVGIHTGPVITGLIGKNKFTFEILGETVEIAKAVQHSGIEGKVNISHTTNAIIADYFDCHKNTVIESKYQGQVISYTIDKFKPNYTGTHDALTPNKHFYDTIEQLDK